MKDVLTIKNLRKSYRLEGGTKQEVLKGITFSLQAGEFAAIIGESGSGKSTLLNVIGGLDSEYAGDILFNGVLLKNYKKKGMDDYRKLNVGFIFQSFNLIPTLSVLENIKTSADMTNRSEKSKHEKAMSLMQKLGIAGIEKQRPSTLSGGQKQRVSIARALMNDPDMILADEPTGALDKENAEGVTQLLKEIAKQGTLVVVVTHSQRVASQCDKVITLEYGVVAHITANQENKNGMDQHQQPLKKNEIKPKKVSIIRSLQNAYKNLIKNKARNILVSLGSGIGIFAVVTMLFLSSGIEAFLTSSLYGSSDPLSLEVTKPESNTGGNVPQLLFASGLPLDQEEITSLEAIEGIEGIELGSTMTQSTTYTFEGTLGRILLLSTTYSSYDPTLKVGRLPIDGEILISDSIAIKLTDDLESLIGSSLPVTVVYDSENAQIGTQNLIISGVIEGQTNFDSAITSAYVTYQTLEKMFAEFGDPLVTTVYLKAESEDQLDAIKQTIESLGFSHTRQDAALSQITSTLDIVTIGLTGIAGISLVVSGIMILVVLFISVVERTKEIGTLRAMGAEQSDIRKNFVSEGLLLGLFGGLLGVILATIIGVMANFILEQTMDASLMDINVGYIVFGMIISVSVSTLASLIPAAKAAKLDPIIALRYE
jgi:ABC-type lipoprotein export system ATPase subunit/ABC-type lipoprotein release transport system permease subunit